MAETVADWLGGQLIDLGGRKKVLRAAGVLSRTGDAARHLGGFSRYLERQYGFVRGDFLEVTYRVRLEGADWTPIAYQQADAEAPLSQSTEKVIHQLRWYDNRLPINIELHLIGYSLGGAVLFRAVGALFDEDEPRWRNRVRSLITLSSPLLGSDLGPEGELLGLFGLGALLPGGAVARELCALGNDPGHKAQVQRQAELLRDRGVRLLTLADELDTVVTPEDAVIAPPVERDRYIFSSSRALQGGAYEGAVLGHGPLLENPRAWALMAQTIGPQEPRLRTASGAIPL